MTQMVSFKKMIGLNTEMKVFAVKIIVAKSLVLRAVNVNGDDIYIKIALIR